MLTLGDEAPRLAYSLLLSTSEEAWIMHLSTFCLYVFIQANVRKTNSFKHLTCTEVEKILSSIMSTLAEQYQNAELLPKVGVVYPKSAYSVGNLCQWCSTCDTHNVHIILGCHLFIWVSKFCGTIKEYNIYLIGTPEGEERENHQD